MHKKYIIIFSLICSCYFQVSFALSYTTDFSNTIQYGENSSETINKAKLLEKYVRNYKKDLLEIQIRLEIQRSNTLIRVEKDIELMIDALIKVQSKYIQQNDAEEIISSVVQGLKRINTTLEPYIKQQQRLYIESLNETKREYIIIGKKISNSLFMFIKKLSINLSEKPSLSEKQKEVVKSLARLNENRTKIQEFAETPFQNKTQMREYYVDIIRSIRSEIQIIKNLL